MVFLKFVGESVAAPGSNALMAAGRTRADPQASPPGNQTQVFLSVTVVLKHCAGFFSCPDAQIFCL